MKFAKSDVHKIHNPFSPFSRSQLKEGTHSHSQPSVCIYSPSLFFKSHYDVIQEGLFCTHAGFKKNPQVYYFNIHVEFVNLFYGVKCFIGLTPSVTNVLSK